MCRVFAVKKCVDRIEIDFKGEAHRVLVFDIHQLALCFLSASPFGHH